LAATAIDAIARQSRRAFGKIKGSPSHALWHG